MQYDAGQSTRLGNRAMNQDRCNVFSADDVVLLVLADGMGGHPRGEQAAQYTVDTFEVLFRRATKPIADPEAFLRMGVEQAHKQIVQFGQRQRPPITPKTTCVAALLQQGFAWWAHVGDSRLYVMRNGQFRQRTRDHSYVEQLYRSGQIAAEERKVHKRRNYVTRCLGGEDKSAQPTISLPFPLCREDVLLLCTDGLWGAIDDDDLLLAWNNPAPVESVLAELTERAAQLRAPESDNVTAVAVRYGAEAATSVPPELAALAGQSPENLDLAAKLSEIYRDMVDVDEDV